MAASQAVTTLLLGPHGLGAADWLGLLGHFLLLSMLAIGGAIATAPDMHRYLVVQQHWLSDAQFTSSVALAQAAPGPNLLFVAVLGYNAAGLAGVAVTLTGILVPSTLLTLTASRWGSTRAGHPGVRAFVAGMAPVTLGLLLATGWLLTAPSRDSGGAVLLVALTTGVMWRSRVSPIWLVAVGAVVGAAGYA